MVQVDTSQAGPRFDVGMFKRTRDILLPLVSTYGLRTLALLYGLIILFLFALRAVYEGLLVNKPSKTFWHELEKGKVCLGWGHST